MPNFFHVTAEASRSNTPERMCVVCVRMKTQSDEQTESKKKGYHRNIYAISHILITIANDQSDWQERIKQLGGQIKSAHSPGYGAVRDHTSI